MIKGFQLEEHGHRVPTGFKAKKRRTTLDHTMRTLDTRIPHSYTDDKTHFDPSL